MSLKLAGTAIARASGSGPPNHRAERPSPAPSSWNRQSPTSDLRSRVAVSMGRSMAGPPVGKLQDEGRSVGPLLAEFGLGRGTPAASGRGLDDHRPEPFLRQRVGEHDHGSDHDE